MLTQCAQLPHDGGMNQGTSTRLSPRQRAKRRREKAKRDSERKARIRTERKLAGVCTDCVAPLPEDHPALVCPPCAERRGTWQTTWRSRLRRRPAKRARFEAARRDADARLRQARIDRGLCYRCASPEPEAPGLRCAACRELHATGQRIRGRAKRGRGQGRGFALLMEAVERVMPGRLESPVSFSDIIRRIEEDEGPLVGSRDAVDRRVHRALDRLIRHRRIARVGVKGVGLYVSVVTRDMSQLATVGVSSA